VGGRETGSSGAGTGTGASGGTARGSGDGGTSGSGVTAARTPGTGDGVDLRAYHDLLRRHIGEALEYPASLRRRGLTGTVEIEISVRADGTIGDVTLTRSSTSSSVDAAALDAVKRLPPVRFPTALPPRALRVRVPVVFDLR
jgi:protein TonB